MIRRLLRKLMPNPAESTGKDSGVIERTERMNARLLAITESAHDMIATFDLRGQILYLNRAGYDFLGIRELNGKQNQLEQYLTVPATMRLVEGLRMALEQGYWQDESEWITAGGIGRTASQTVVAHVEEAGGEPYFSTIVRDISDRKEIERELIHAKQAADEANEAKSSFLARMSHEIRTPLNGIIGLTHLLQRSELSDGQRDYLRQITSSSNSLLYILNDLLDYAKLEADKLTVVSVPFRLDDSLERLSGIFAVLLGTKPVDLIVRTDSDVPDVLYGDHVRLEQVLLNLVNNAIKFTEQGYVSLHVKVIRRNEMKTTLRFVVTDTGIGMTAEQRAGLFKPFVQADERTSRTYGGTGLGLVISQSLIQLMGGSGIDVDSRYREGSTFNFDLSFPAHDGFSLFDDRCKGMRVLILEDSSIMQDYWLTTLAEIGCSAETAPDWTAARRLLAQGGWDVWIADMEAGDMHGEETWVDWKKEADRLGVALVCSTTLHGRDALLSLSDEAKPAEILVKPVVRPQLVHALLQAKYRGSNTYGRSVPPLSSVPALEGTVLVVEDNEINRIVARQMLESCGLQVREAGHGLEALRLMDTIPVDLVLMDIQMPVMDGFETARHIRQDGRWNSLPILAMTAEAMDDSAGKCLQAGMNGLILKPVEPGMLHNLLKRWLPSDERGEPGEPGMPNDTLIWPDTDTLDIPLALHRLDGKTGLYLQLLERFAKEYTDLPARLRGMPDSADSAVSERLLHSFRGASAHLGAIPVAREALLLEDALKQNRPAGILLESLEERLKQLLEVIDDILRRKRS